MRRARREPSRAVRPSRPGSPSAGRLNVRVLTVIGNRPQFIKAAAVSHRLRDRAHEVLVHTGQHYDASLSQVFFEELALPRPEHRLDLGGGSNTSQTARMLAALEPLLRAERPDAVLVYGDTNSTLAGALAGAQAGVPVAHVEAGGGPPHPPPPPGGQPRPPHPPAPPLLWSSPAAAAPPRRRGAP